MLNLEIHTDGSSYPNNGQGQTGGGIVFKFQGKLIGYSVHFGKGTNNTAELSAIGWGLKESWEKMSTQIENARDKIRVTLYSDSEYALNSLSGMWTLTPKKKNYELIKSIKCSIADTWSYANVEFNHEYGHSDNELNNWCDELANEGRLGQEKRYERLA